MFDILMQLTEFSATLDIFLPVFAQIQTTNINETWVSFICWEGCSEVKTKALIFDFNHLMCVRLAKVAVIIK